MTRHWPHDEIPDQNVWPSGIVQLEVEELEETQSKSNKLMFTATFKGVLPPDVENIPHFEYYVIGSDDDPQAQDVKTWKKSMGAQQLKKLLRALQVPLVDDLHQAIAMAKGKQALVTTTQVTETAEGEYKGRIRCNLGRFFALGERQAAIAPEQPGVVGIASAVAAPIAVAPVAAAPLAVAPPVIPPAAAPVAAPIPGAGAPVAAPPVVPPAAVPPGTPVAAAPPQAANPEEMLACSLCPPGTTPIARKDFAAHIQLHEAGQLPAAG